MKQRRDLCSIATKASDGPEFEMAISRLREALREHALIQYNIQAKKALQIAAEKRKSQA
jgi:hypothetical protein